ncbi:MAG: hypothetical protein RL670_929 [Actinomycetota bacterium]|jgi:glyoxylase-like metal-dependent hydrolase (beta-lactamase superfamily II)
MADLTDNPHAKEAAARWPEQYAESNRRLAKLSKDEQQRIFDAHGIIASKLADEFNSGSAVDSSQVQELIGEHYRWICNFWTPGQAAYVGLGEMYVADERFAANYDKFATGLADFMRQAMRQYAFAQLG